MRCQREVQSSIEGGRYLEYESCEIKGWKVYGDPSSPRFGSGAFQYGPEDAQRLFERIPADTEVLITHGPPFGTLDSTLDGDSVGCPQLAAAVSSLKRLRLHVFGHIHEAWGFSVNERGVVSVNAACQWNVGPVIVVDLLDGV